MAKTALSFRNPRSSDTGGNGLGGVTMQVLSIGKWIGGIAVGAPIFAKC